jgi:hypothetical protein
MESCGAYDRAEFADGRAGLKYLEDVTPAGCVSVRDSELPMVRQPRGADLIRTASLYTAVPISLIVPACARARWRGGDGRS